MSKKQKVGLRCGCVAMADNWPGDEVECADHGPTKVEWREGPERLKALLNLGM